jgi:outer membrane protein TolC
LPRTTAIPEPDLSFTDEQARLWPAKASPDLKRLDALIHKEDAGLRLARKQAWPDVTLGLDVVDTGDALNPDTPDSGKDPVMAMVSITLPIWRDRIRAGEQEARHNKAAAEAARLDAGRQLDSDLELALFHLRDAQRKINLYGNTLIPKAQQSLAVAQRGFETGSTTFPALMDAQRLLLEFQLALHRARADRGEHLARIELITGHSASGTGEPKPAQDNQAPTGEE